MEDGVAGVAEDGSLQSMLSEKAAGLLEEPGKVRRGNAGVFDESGVSHSALSRGENRRCALPDLPNPPPALRVEGPHDPAARSPCLQFLLKTVKTRGRLPGTLPFHFDYQNRLGVRRNARGAPVPGRTDQIQEGPIQGLERRGRVSEGD